MNWDLLNKFEKKESDDLTNVQYTLNVSAVLDAMGIKEIFQNTSEHTSKDPILNELRKLIKSDKNYIPKKNPNLNPYGDILSESVSNGTLVNHDKIKKVIKLAHSGIEKSSHNENFKK